MLSAAICIFIVGFSEVYTAASIINTNKRTFIIDAGHGGFDGGASFDKVLEKNINLEISLRLKELLSVMGYDIIMIRETDTAVNTEGNSIRTKKISDMKNRLKIMQENSSATFISIHLNKYSDNIQKGLQVFYSPNDNQSLVIAENIQSTVKSILQKDNRRKVKKATKEVFLLYNAPIPAVIVECGFLSNTLDRQNLTNPIYQQKLAFAIFCGIINNNNL